MDLNAQFVEGPERVEADYRQDDLPSISMGLYEFFLAQGEQGRDALLIYQHLLYTYRLQGTNQPWATVGYLQRGLALGRERVKAARAFLHEHGVISYVQNRGADGKVGKVYTKLNLKPNPGKAAKRARKTAGPENRPTVAPPYGDGQQMLEERIEVLEEKREREALLPALEKEHGELPSQLKAWIAKEGVNLPIPAVLTAIRQYVAKGGKLRFFPEDGKKALAEAVADHEAAERRCRALQEAEAERARQQAEIDATSDETRARQIREAHAKHPELFRPVALAS